MTRVLVDVVFRTTVLYDGPDALRAAVKRLADGVTSANSVGDLAFSFHQPDKPTAVQVVRPRKHLKSKAVA